MTGNFMLRAESVPSARSLEKEPRPSLRFVGPNLDQTRGRNVAMFVANIVCFTKARGQLSIVLRELRDHVQRLDVLGIVIEHALSATDLTDRSQRKSANLSNSLGDRICHREELVGALIEKQMVIAEMRTAHVPVEIFCFHIKREHVRENGVHRCADILNRRMREIGSRLQRRIPPLQKFYGLFRIRSFHRNAPSASCFSYSY